MYEYNTHLLQVYSRPSDVRLFGLFAASDPPNRPFILTAEQTLSAPVSSLVQFLPPNAPDQQTTSTPVASRVNVLRRNAPEQQLSFVQSVTLEEPFASSVSSFASGSNGNVFCAISGSQYVHEICRRMSGTSASAAPFVGSKAHRLPTVAHNICGYQFAGEQRLVACFIDKTVRVFERRMADCLKCNWFERLLPTGLPCGSWDYPTLKSASALPSMKS